MPAQALQFNSVPRLVRVTVRPEAEAVAARQTHIIREIIAQTAVFRKEASACDAGRHG